jgi:PadR family transcriptional regulator PadR
MIQVALALLEEPDAQHWGYELSKRSGVRSGVLYPLLRRMMEQGILVDGWEDRAAIERKRPPRRYYKLTPDGRRALGAQVQLARTEPRFRGLFPGFAQ